MITLKRALERFTDHQARLITFKQTYLDYETDVFDPTLSGAEALVEWADFYILGEVPSPRMQTDLLLEKIQPNNCIVRAGGTCARMCPALYMTGKFADIMKTGAYHDPTIASRIFPMAHTVNMYFFDEWPQRQRPADEEPIRLVFSGTAQKHHESHSGAIAEAWKQLSEDLGDRVEFVNIEQQSWKESLRIKAECDICYDQLLLGAYASSSIEGMFYRMPTFCYVSGWCKAIHPCVPLISVRAAGEILERTKYLINHSIVRKSIGDGGREYVLRTHDASKAVKRWVALIDFVYDEFRR